MIASGGGLEAGGVTVNGYGVSLEGDENVPIIYYSDGSTTLNIQKPMKFIL